MHTHTVGGEVNATQRYESVTLTTGSISTQVNADCDKLFPEQYIGAYCSHEGWHYLYHRLPTGECIYHDQDDIAPAVFLTNY